MEPMEILFQDVPLWTVKPKRFTRVGVELHDCNMIETSPLQPKRLSTGAGTDFDRR